ncbi:MAG: FG-GAP repeat domain-containing protein [Bacteroidota bacterium]
MNVNKPIFTLVLIAILSTSCGKKSPENDPRFDGNRKMVQLLDSLSKAADPVVNFYLSAERAERMRTHQPAFKSQFEKLMWNKTYYNELLNAGKTEEAAVGFNFLLTDANYAPLLDKKMRNELEQMLAVSYLRSGELQNCVVNHTSQSCIVPIQKEGQHKIRTGSENAIRTYLSILETTPDDLNSRWLLNIAAMTLGEYPQAVPEKFRIPIATFEGKGNEGKFKDRAIDLGLDIDGLAGGSIIEDFNNDGSLDIFCTSYGLTDQCHLFFNNNKGGFEEVTESAQLMGITGGLNAKQADYDNDGYTDILILRGAWLDKGGEFPNSLLHNNGDGTFSDVTFEAGMVNFRPTETAAWADIDMDGLLDVFVANEYNPKNQYPCELWRNNGNGTFTDIAKELGLDGNFGFVKGVNISDFNNDGRPDFYLSVLAGGDKKGKSNDYLFMGRPAQNKYKIQFEDIAENAGILGPNFSFPSAVFDYNQDGFEDIYVTGFDMNRLEKCGEDACREYLGMPVVAELPRMYRNNGDETFTDVTEEVGLNKVTYGMGMNYGDIDNDGWIDVYVGTGAFDFRTIVPNRMFRNVEGKYFEEVTMNGTGHLQKGHGIAFGDLDNDGDQDIYSVMGGAYDGDNAKNILFENPGPAGQWVSLSVDASTGNKAAYGSKLKLTLKMRDGSQRIVYSCINSGATFGANSLRQEIGLGDAVQIENVELLWALPGKKPLQFGSVPMNAHSTLVEKGLKVNTSKLEAHAFTATSASGHEHHHGH